MRQSGKTLDSKAILLASGVAAGLAGVSAPALAGDQLGGGPSARASAMCAAFGPGFQAVEGSDACIFVAGHVRVGFGSRAGNSPDTGWATGSAVRVNAASGGDTVAITPGHLRLRDSDSDGVIAR